MKPGPSQSEVISKGSGGRTLVKIWIVSTEVWGRGEKVVIYLRDGVIGLSCCGTVMLKIVRGDKEGGAAVKMDL